MWHSLRILCAVLTYMGFKNISNILAYEQLSQENDGPKLYKASNLDLIFPHSIVTTPTNEINDQTEMRIAEIFRHVSKNDDDSMAAATGRAASYQSPNYPFGHLIKPLMKNTPQRITSISKNRGITDRFTPSEAVASHQLKTNYHNHAFSHSDPLKAPSSQSANNLYAFPPDNTNYPVIQKSPENLKTSYSSPPSGPLNEDDDIATDNDYKYLGPLNPDYLAALANSGAEVDQVHDDTNNGGVHETNMPDSSDMLGVLPASAMKENNLNDMNIMMDSVHVMYTVNASDNEQEYPTPPPDWLKNHPEAVSNPPPSLLTHHSPEDYDHHLTAYNHNYQPSIYSHDPELIYDNHVQHHSYNPHLHYYPHYHTTTTTQAPPPEPPPEPRVKKYSYFYIGRKLWYIPLYFTVWFTFYVLWLILKSIARHKVNLPNHYVNRRSLENYDLEKIQQYRVDELTTTIFDNLERFRNKYLR
uniref:Uncharacterized protein n=1 Tax=Glossina brevipalpis TaxID=37001 RepID=A0A1A9W3Y7_9MUSC